MSQKTRIKLSSFTALKNKVFVTDLDRGVHRTAGGIIIPDDDMTERGVRNRWGKVFAIGPEVTDVALGDWVLIEHGRWTEQIVLDFEEGAVNVWQIDYPAAVLMTSDQDPTLARITL